MSAPNPPPERQDAEYVAGEGKPESGSEVIIVPLWKSFVRSKNIGYVGVVWVRDPRTGRYVLDSCCGAPHRLKHDAEKCARQAAARKNRGQEAELIDGGGDAGG